MESYQTQGNAQNDFSASAAKQVALAQMQAQQSMTISQPPHMNRMIDMLRESRARVGDANAMLSTLRDRLFGCVPANANGAGGKISEVPNGAADEAVFLATALNSELANLANLVSTIEARL